jgi:hypothetical protein
MSVIDASEDEVDQATRTTRSQRPRPRPRPRQVRLAILALLAALIILLIAVDHRSTPCKLRITCDGVSGGVEQCASPTTPGHRPEQKSCLRWWECAQCSCNSGRLAGNRQR